MNDRKRNGDLRQHLGRRLLQRILRTPATEAAPPTTAEDVARSQVPQIMGALFNAEADRHERDHNERVRRELIEERRERNILRRFRRWVDRS
jgi:hypothetical protein